MPTLLAASCIARAIAVASVPQTAVSQKPMPITPPVFAIARSFESSGRAVLAVSLLLIAQFGLLSFSGFIPTANFGLMTAVGLFSGQLFELLLLPALLLMKDGRKPALKAQPAVTR